MTEHLCWFCRSPLVWQQDVEPMDIDLLGEGVVAILHCSSCKAEAHFIHIESYSEEE